MAIITWPESAEALYNILDGDTGFSFTNLVIMYRQYANALEVENPSYIAIDDKPQNFSMSSTWRHQVKPCYNSGFTEVPLFLAKPLFLSGVVN